MTASTASPASCVVRCQPSVPPRPRTGSLSGTTAHLDRIVLARRELVEQERVLRGAIAEARKAGASYADLARALRAAGWVPRPEPH